MKLKEKLAEDWLIQNRHWNERMDKFLLDEYSSFYLAGFEKAREMAEKQLRSHFNEVLKTGLGAPHTAISLANAADNVEHLGEDEIDG